MPYYFFSRYPLETTRLWNLKNLLSPTSWFAYFLTIILVISFLKLSSYVGTKLGLNTVTEEIALVPCHLSILSNQHMQRNQDPLILE